jgi:hypothetical protein
LQVAIALFGFAAVAAIAEAGLIGHADHYVSSTTIIHQNYFKPPKPDF